MNIENLHFHTLTIIDKCSLDKNKKLILVLVIVFLFTAFILDMGNYYHVTCFSVNIEIKILNYLTDIIMKVTYIKTVKILLFPTVTGTILQKFILG